MQKKQILLFFLAASVVSMQIEASWHKFVSSPLKTAFRYVHKSSKNAFQKIDQYALHSSCLKRTRGACSHLVQGVYPQADSSSYQQLVDRFVKEMKLDPIDVYKVPFSEIQAFAEVQMRGMVVCEKQLGHHSDTIKEFILKHELMHHKYSDLYSKIAFLVGSGCCTAGSFYFLYKKFGLPALYSLPAFIAGWLTSLHGFRYYQEGRADKEAAFATAKGCPNCMDEIAELHKSYKTRTAAGYLGFENYKKYADCLRNATPVHYCERHSKK